MFFCVGVLAPPASALMRDPDQPRVDERLPEGDEGGWGEVDSIENPNIPNRLFSIKIFFIGYNIYYYVPSERDTKQITTIYQNNEKENRRSPRINKK